MRLSRAWFLIALTLVTAIAAATRLYELGRPSFWGDELFSIRAVGMPEGSVLARTFSHAPTSVGLWLSGVDVRAIDPDRPDTWSAMGVNEWNARIGSCVVGILSIPILILAARRILGVHVALLAGLLLALAPWHILWSQAARFYTLQFLFYSLCLIWYFQWRTQRHKRLLVATVVALVLAFFAQPTSLIALAVIGADLAIGMVRREIVLTKRDLMLIGSGSGLCLALLGYYILDHGEIWARFVAFTGELRYQSPLTLFAGAMYMVQLPIAALALLSALWLMQRDRTSSGFLLLAALLPIALMMFWSMWNFVGLRYVLITLWWWLVLAAIGLAALYRALEPSRGRVLALAPSAIVIVALMVPLYAYYKDGYGYRGRWREAFVYTLTHIGPNEQIATTYNQLHVAQYYSGRMDVLVLPWTLEEVASKFDAPTWLVFQAETSVRGTAQEWARSSAELRAAFDLRVPQPIELVQVYRLLPFEIADEQPDDAEAHAAARRTEREGAP